jgi:hypothetical protein
MLQSLGPLPSAIAARYLAGRRASSITTAHEGMELVSDELTL